MSPSEIAAKVRHANGIFAFVSALGIDVDSDWCWTDVSRRVADLIDPTCKVVQKKVYAGGPQMYKTLWCCSECGFPLAESKYKGHIPFVAYSFCQRCGARVVRDNERCYKDSHR